jgi:hypothetical protein
MRIFFLIPSWSMCYFGEPRPDIATNNVPIKLVSTIFTLTIITHTHFTGDPTVRSDPQLTYVYQ